MKLFRTLLILLSIFSAGMAAAQNSVFIPVSKTGDCSILENGEWVPLKVGMPLTIESKLRNTGQSEAELQLIGRETGDSYKVYLLQSEFDVQLLFESPQREYHSGTLSSYIRYLVQTAMESSSEAHFTRSYTGITQRNETVSFNTDINKILYAVTRGTVFSFEALKDAPSDYHVAAEILPGGIILDNSSETSLYFILFSLEESKDGVNLNSVFGEDNLLIVPANTQRLYEEAVLPEDTPILLIAYHDLIDPITLKRAFYNIEGVIPPVQEKVKVGIFSTY